MADVRTCLASEGGVAPPEGGSCCARHSDCRGVRVQVRVGRRDVAPVACQREENEGRCIDRAHLSRR